MFWYTQQYDYNVWIINKSTTEQKQKLLNELLGELNPYLDNGKLKPVQSRRIHMLYDTMVYLISKLQ